MQLKKLIQNYKNLISVFLLGAFSFFINYHYGFIGIMPMDNTVLFNGGFRVLKGYVPFTDYWLVTGPLLDYLNALFFKFLGLSWSTFILHSSAVNVLITIASYFLFINLDLTNKFSFFYALQISILFYPVVGTPFVDHHSTFFLIIAFYLLILAIKKSNHNYYIFIPIMLVLSFLSKQTPAVYGVIALFFLILIHGYYEKKNLRKIINNSIIGSFLSLIFLILFFWFTKINLSNFIEQYLLFASSIGNERLSNYDFNIINEIDNYKFIYLFIFFLLYLFVLSQRKNFLNLKAGFIILVSITLSIILIFHQMITLNQNYIFFLVPFLAAIFHSFFNKKFMNQYLLIFTISVCIFSVTKYHLRFNEERKFNELENIDISKAVDAATLDEKLKGLKWITYLNPDDPDREIKSLKEVLQILKSDIDQKILITEYQVIAPILESYDNSPNQWHHPSVSFPLKGNKYFEIYKNYFIKKIKENKIQTVYETREDDFTILELVLNPNCFFNKKERVSAMLIKMRLNQNCEDLR